MGERQVDDHADRLDQRAGEVQGVGGGSDLDAEVVGSVGDDGEDVVARGDDDPVVAGEPVQVLGRMVDLTLRSSVAADPAD